MTSLAAVRRAVPAAFCLLLLWPGKVRADAWTTYAHPNDLRAIAAAGDTLWMASTGGALRFVPATGEFRQYGRRVGGGPLSQDLTAVCADTLSGLVYFGSSDNGVSEYHVAGGRWRRFEAIPSPAVNNVVMVDSLMYVATAAGFSVRISATRTDICNEVDRACCGDDLQTCNFPSFDVRDFVEHEGHLWAATAGGPAEMDGTRWWSRKTGGNVIASRSLASHAGTLFVATAAAGGIFRWNPALERWEAAVTGLRLGRQFGDQVRLTETGGRLFLCCDYGLFEWGGEAWQGTGLEDWQVRGVVAMPPGRAGGYSLFAATRNGLFAGRAEGSGITWVQFPAPGPPQNITPQAVAADQNGVLWFASLGGVMSLTPEGAWTSWTNDPDTTHAALRSGDLYSLFVDSGSRLWVGKCCCKDPPRCATQFIDDGVVSPLVEAYDGWGMAEDAAGRLWIGSNVDGVHVLDSQGSAIVNLTPENTSGKLRSTSIRAVAAEGNHIWLGHEELGLQVITLGADVSDPATYAWKNFITSFTSGLPDAAVFDIAVQGSDVWVVSSGYLTQFNGTSRVGTALSLSFDGVPRRGSAIVIDRRETRWVATSNGILKVTAAGAVSVLDTGNSDLISDDILDAALDPVSGDLLFATRLGWSRLRPGGATGADDGSGLFLYPNPFFPWDATGGVTVRVGGGTAAEALVTDLLGRPVARFDPETGWDATDQQGRLVSPGVYLVVVDGREVLRLAVVR